MIPRPLDTHSLVFGAWLSRYFGPRSAWSNKAGASALRGNTSRFYLRVDRSEHLELGCGRTSFLSGGTPIAHAQTIAYTHSIFTRLGGLYDRSTILRTKMYGSRKVKVKFAKSTWDDQLKGIGFASSSYDRDEPQEKTPMAPPSPLPPSPAPPSPQAADFDFEEKFMGQMKEDEFTRHAREQTKAQLESITGRMFQVD